MPGESELGAPSLTQPGGPPAAATLQPEGPAAARGRRGWPDGVALLLYLLLTLFYLGPLLGRFFQDVPFGGDSWIFYWDLWWVKKALVELQTNPFYTTYVNYPGGASLHFHTLAFLDGLLALPLQLAGMSLAGAYNTLVVFGYLFSAYGMYRLADYVVGHKPGAFVAGLIFGFSPFHFSKLNGQLNFVSIQWVPFYVLFLLKASEEGRSGQSRWRYCGLAGLLLAFNALTEWTLAAFLVLFSGLYLLWRLWEGRHNRGGLTALLRGPVLSSVVVMAVFAALTAPVLLPMLNEARTNRNIKYDPQETVIYSADLLSFVTPYELHPLLGQWSRKLAEQARPGSNPAERTTYLGLTALLTAGAGVWLRRKKRGGTGLWVLTGLTFGLLALGPVLHLAGKSEFTVFKVNLPLPYAALYYFPFFSIMRTPARFVLVAMLALAVLSAFGVKGLSERLQSGHKLPASLARYSGVALATLLSIGIIFEFAPYVTTAYPNVPAIYEPVRRDPDPAHAVLELPYRQASHFYIAQPAYDKPMVGGYLARQADNPLIEQIPALRSLALRSNPAQGEASQLKQAGIRYVMVNWWMLDEAERPRMQAALQQVFGRSPDAQELEPDGSRMRLSLYTLT